MYLLIARRNCSLTGLILNKFLFFLNSGRLVQFQHLSKMTDSTRPLQPSQGFAQNNSVCCSNLLTPSYSLRWMVYVHSQRSSSALLWAPQMHTQLQTTLLRDKNSPFSCCAYIGEVGVSNLWHTLCTLIEQFVSLPVGLACLGLKACMKGVSRRITLTLQFPWCDQSSHIAGSIYLHNWGRGVGSHLFILTCCMLCWPQRLYAQHTQKSNTIPSNQC